MADLGHHELEIELVGDQRDRDVGAAQSVRGGVGQRRHPPGRQALAGEARRLGEDLPDPPAREAPVAQPRDEVSVGTARPPLRPQPIKVGEHRSGEFRAQLDKTPSRLGLGVADPQARSPLGIDAQVLDPRLAQLPARSPARPNNSQTTRRPA